MKKLLCTALIGMVIMSGGCGQGLKEGFKDGFNSTYNPKTVEEKSEPVEETVEEPQEKELEDIINGNEEYVFNRPNGDWGIRFKASIYQTLENGNCVYVEYWVHNISFHGSIYEIVNDSETLIEDIVYFDIYEGAAVIDSKGNILTPCGGGHGDEIISAEPVYVGCTGHFSHTFFVEDPTALDGITIKITLPEDMTYTFQVPIE